MVGREDWVPSGSTRQSFLSAPEALFSADINVDPYKDSIFFGVAVETRRGRAGPATRSTVRFCVGPLI